MAKHRIHSGWWLTAIGFGALASASAISCTAERSERAASSPVAPSVEQAPTTSPSAAPASQPMGTHWVQDQRLRVLMAELSKRNPTWPAGVPQEPEATTQARPEGFQEVADLADGLRLSAGRLPDLAKRLQMNEADRRGFVAEAEVLRDQAERLRDAARRHEIERMQEDMTSLNATCISCHSRFRDFSGKLNSPQALLGVPTNLPNSRVR